MSYWTLMLHPFYECIRKLFSCQSTQMRDKPNFAIIVTFRVWRAQNFWHRKTIRKMLLSRTKVFMRNAKIRNKFCIRVPVNYILHALLKLWNYRNNIVLTCLKSALPIRIALPFRILLWRIRNCSDTSKLPLTYQIWS